MSTTRIELLRDLAEELYRETQDIATGIAADHTTASLTDGIDLYYSSADANTYDRKFVYLEALGEQSRITEGGLSTAGVLTLSPVVTDAPTVVTGDASNVSTTSTTLADSDESPTANVWIGYTIYAGGQTLDVTANTTGGTFTGTGGWSYGGSGPGAVVWTVGTRYIISDHRIQTLRRAINDVLRNTYVPCFFPLSIHIVQNDANDMEASTVATDYEIGTGAAALAIETTNVYSGVQSLKVTCDNANEYAALKSKIPVNEDMRLHAAAMCSVTQGDDAAFRIWNVQAAEIDSATSDEVAWMNLQPPAFTIPSGCEQIDLRLEGIGSDDVTYWDDVQVWYDGAGVYPLPAYIQSPSQLLAVHAVPRGTAGPGADNDYRTDEQASYPLRWEWESKAPGSMRIKVSCGDARPYLVTLRPLSELASDSATTPADKDKVVDFAADLIRNPEEGYKRLREHVAAILTRPDTHVLPRVGRSIR